MMLCTCDCWLAHADGNLSWDGLSWLAVSAQQPLAWAGDGSLALKSTRGRLEIGGADSSTSLARVVTCSHGKSDLMIRSLHISQLTGCPEGAGI